MSRAHTCSIGCLIRVGCDAYLIHLDPLIIAIIGQENAEGGQISFFIDAFRVGESSHLSIDLTCQFCCISELLSALKTNKWMLLDAGIGD